MLALEHETIIVHCSYKSINEMKPNGSVNGPYANMKESIFKQICDLPSEQSNMVLVLTTANQLSAWQAFCECRPS